MTQTVEDSPRLVGSRLGRPVSFECESCVLHGTLHEPSAPVRDHGIIILNQGPNDRAGSHRISITLARAFEDRGHVVLRFDARGVGESQGEWVGLPDGVPIRDLYVRIEQGAWVPDVRAAMAFMRQATGVKRFVLMGLCGGALTAIHAGADDPSVDGIVMIGPTVRLSSSITGVDDLVASKVKHEVRDYLAKLARPAAWKRFLTLDTDYHTLGAVLLKYFRLSSTRETQAVESHSGINAHFVRSVKTAVGCRKPLVFIYGDRDYLWQEFEKYFLSEWHDGRRPFDIATISGANHIFSEDVSQRDLGTTASSWVDARNSVGTTP